MLPFPLLPLLPLLQLISITFTANHAAGYGGGAISPCETSCYPTHCNSFISNLQSHTTPNSLSLAAVDRSLAATRSASRFPVRAGLVGPTVEDCTELMEFSSADLKLVKRKLMSSKNVTSTEADDLMTLMSSAVAGAGTCLDGLEEAGMIAGTSESTNAATAVGSFMFNIPSNRTVIVAKDGSGDFTSVNDAIAYATQSRRSPSAFFKIIVKRGIYVENVVVPKKLTGLILKGGGMRRTFITGNRSVGDGYSTYQTATLARKQIPYVETKVLQVIEASEGPNSVKMMDEKLVEVIGEVYNVSSVFSADSYSKSTLVLTKTNELIQG
ncbi:probable pectinesterase/pectinesterase inhibitor 12 [Phalaenopsis equestris]|uniref:probable pectinesterase/pectinesterase inhibitor 12 n=1 Tax=Phalaenopsis equestris TaxID=78828 RepID=UPI0009E5373A|nr:probable pectinesterase/pectinesterase inhibitor 12 [Phalaenopsis equestris]